jgi:hypothetical protein
MNLENEEVERKIDGPIAFAHFDLDYYTPTLKALQGISTSMQTGTILMFDNYFFFRGDSSLGEQRAIREYAKESKVDLLDFFTYGWHGKAFIVNVR